MPRLTTLLCLVIPLAAPAAAREPPAARALPWTEHPVLSAPTPLLAVSDRETTDGGTTGGFFARLTGMGFACMASEPPWRRVRRTEVVCARDGDGVSWFGYAGGWPKGGGVFIVDRIRAGRGASAELLGGARVGLHVRWVLEGVEPTERVVTMRDTSAP